MVPSKGFKKFFVFKIVVDSWKFSMLLLYILKDDQSLWVQVQINSYSRNWNTLYKKPDCHSWWISKMQSDIFEEQYAIKFCFKHGKNATETYGMLQTAFGASYMNQASFFEWHKRFKEGRESVRDDDERERERDKSRDRDYVRFMIHVRVWPVLP